MSFSLDSLSAVELSKLIKSGGVSAKEVTEQAYSLIESRDDKVQAFLELSEDLAFSAAQKIDEARAKLSLIHI